MAVVPLDKGREAVSEYKTLESFPEHTLLEVHPLTGRTHQIRVHMAFLGCPVVGDTVYGKKKAANLDLKRHFLHAYKLKIILPGESQAAYSKQSCRGNWRQCWGDLGTRNELRVTSCKK